MSVQIGQTIVPTVRDTERMIKDKINDRLDYIWVFVRNLESRINDLDRIVRTNKKV